MARILTRKKIGIVSGAIMFTSILLIGLIAPTPEPDIQQDEKSGGGKGASVSEIPDQNNQADNIPTSTPTATPTAEPTNTPIPSPTLKPTVKPTAIPTPLPMSAQTKIILIPTATSYPAPTANTGGFVCDCGKTCPNISSCEEAQYLLNVCGCSRRDGDKDGIACDAAPLNCQN